MVSTSLPQPSSEPVSSILARAGSNGNSTMLQGGREGRGGAAPSHQDVIRV